MCISSVKKRGMHGYYYCQVKVESKKVYFTELDHSSELRFVRDAG